MCVCLNDWRCSRVCVCTSVCRYVCMLVCIVMYVCMYVCMYVNMYVFMHACMYVCMYVSFACMVLGEHTARGMSVCGHAPQTCVQAHYIRMHV